MSKKYTKEDKEILKRGLIFYSLSGSHAYGLSRPESDLDFRGVFIGSKEDVYGLNRREQFDKFTFDDIQIYELRKFFKLASECNPNILELLYIERPIWTNEFWENIRRERKVFLSKKAAFKFLGYANAQLKRIKGHKKWITNPMPIEPPDAKDFKRKIYQEVGIGSIDAGFSSNRPFIYIYDNDAYKAEHRRWKQYWHWKKNRNEARAKLEEKYGYDTKHAMHLIRLLHCMKEILTEGTLTVNRLRAGDAGFLLGIRNGKMKYEKLIEYAEGMMLEAEEIDSPLPKRPDINYINKLMLDTYDHFWAERRIKRTSPVELPDDFEG